MHFLAIFLPIIILPFLIIAATNDPEPKILNHSIKFYTKPSIPSNGTGPGNLCLNDDFVIALGPVKIPDIRTLQANATGDVSKISQRYFAGMWAFYSGLDYTMTKSWSLDIVGGCCACISSECSDPENCIIRSFRHLGNPDFHKPGLSLLTGDGSNHITGTEKYIEDSVDSIEPPFCAAFWAITGNQNWTLYSGPSFTGGSVCVTVSPSKNQTYGTGNLRYWYIRSAKRGPCTSDNILSADENFRMSEDGQVRIFDSSLPAPKTPADYIFSGSFESCAHLWSTTTSTSTTSTSTTMDPAATKPDHGDGDKQNPTRPGFNGVEISIDAQILTFMTTSLISTFALFT